jgi:hypothetical protein
MVVLGAFLTGGAIGVATGRATARPAPRQMDERAMRDELARKLQLSDAQRTVFDSAFEWRRQRSRVIMGVVRPSLDSVRDSARVRMLQSLDSTQKTAFWALIERNRRSADSAARSRGESR